MIQTRLFSSSNDKLNDPNDPNDPNYWDPNDPDAPIPIGSKWVQMTQSLVMQDPNGGTDIGSWWY